MNSELRIKGPTFIGDSIIHYSLFIILAALLIAAAFFIRVPFAHAAPQHNVTGWAWTAAAGWISANSSNCFEANRTMDPNTCTLGGIPEAQGYGVHITDRGALTGWAWSRTVGWMCFGETCTGTGGATPNGGWRARVNAITGEVIGWAKITALGDNGWVAFSCENAGSCGTIAYRTTVDIAGGQFSGHAWNGASAGSALGWISWHPSVSDGVKTSWRPVPLCSKSGNSCTSNIDCILQGEYCCPAGMPCGQCGGNGEECGSSAECPPIDGKYGVLCLPPGVQGGQCVNDGSPCGGDVDCNPQERDACCPPGAVCTSRNQPPPEDGELPPGAQVPIIGVCNGFPTNPVLCVEDAQCDKQKDSCKLDRGICPDNSPGGTAGNACGQPNNPNSGCGGQDCEYDFGIWDNQGLRSEQNPDGKSIPCASSDPGDLHCRRIIGKCTGDNVEQLCAVDENCPEGSQCGKLYLPWLQTKYGSIYSRGNVGSAQTPPPPSGQPSATFCILAGGNIINFTSAQCSKFPGYTLPKAPPYTQRPLRVDVQGILAGRYGEVTSETLPVALNGKVYLVDFTEGGTKHTGGTYSLQAMNFQSNGGAGLLIIKGGNLNIEGNTKYDGALPAQGEERRLGSLGILVLSDAQDDGRGNITKVGGNITIKPQVTEVVGAFYAEGMIRTESSRSRATDRQLRVSGTMIAEQFAFERLYATGAPAELIEASGRVLLNPPPGFIDFAKALPIIQQTVPTP